MLIKDLVLQCHKKITRLIGSYFSPCFSFTKMFRFHFHPRHLLRQPKSSDSRWAICPRLAHPRFVSTFFLSLSFHCLLALPLLFYLPVLLVTIYDKFSYFEVRGDLCFLSTLSKSYSYIDINFNHRHAICQRHSSKGHQNTAFSISTFINHVNNLWLPLHNVADTYCVIIGLVPLTYYTCNKVLTAFEIVPKANRAAALEDR